MLIRELFQKDLEETATAGGTSAGAYSNCS